MLRRSVRSSGPLRLLFVVPDLTVGGAERHVATLLPALDPARFAPSVLCINQPGPLFAEVEAAGIPAVALDEPKNDLRGLLRAACRLVRHVWRTRPDVIVMRGANAELLGRIAALPGRVPHTVVWVHNNSDLQPLRWTQRLADRMLGPWTSAYFGLAEGQLDYLTRVRGFARSKIRLVANGVDPARYPFVPVEGRDGALAAELGIESGDAVVGIVAVLRPEKDHPTFLRAAKLVLEHVPHARFLVVGRSPRPEDLQRLTRLAAELGVADRVLFTGRREDVAEIVALMDVFCLTSTTECFPMSLLEAMAVGRAAVCTAVGGVPEMIDDGVTGHVVPPGDPEVLAERLVELLVDPARAEKMGRAGRDRVEARFTLEGSVRAAERALEETARQRPALAHRARRMRRRAPGPVRLTLLMDHAVIGGAEVLLLNLFRHLDPAVVRPRLLCTKDLGALGPEFSAAGFPVDVLPPAGRYDLRTLARLVRRFRRDRTDVVLVTHLHPRSLTFGRVAARLCGIRSVVAPHGMDLLTYNGHRILPRLDVETMFLSDALVLVAPSQGAYLRRHEKVNTRPWRRVPEVVIPNGISLPPATTLAARASARAALGVGEDDLVVGIVARLAPVKAHELLIEAAAALAPSHPRLVVLCVGGGPRAAELAALTDKLGVADRVRFLGMRRDVTDLVPGFDIACLTSRFECQPLSVIEAMAAGVPMVVSDVGAVRDMITDGVEGRIFPAGDAAALAAHLATLAADPDRRARMGAAGRERAERQFRVEDTARAYEALLTTLVAPDS